MTNQQILEKAIQKAINGGWDKFGYETFTAVGFAKYAFEETPLHRWEQIIFNHDFAKALWGENEIFTGNYVNTSPDYWFTDLEKEYLVAFLFHLQQMVIAEDAIKYLAESLNLETKDTLAKH